MEPTQGRTPGGWDATQSHLLPKRVLATHCVPGTLQTSSDVSGPQYLQKVGWQPRLTWAAHRAAGQGGPEIATRWRQNGLWGLQYATGELRMEQELKHGGAPHPTPR